MLRYLAVLAAFTAHHHHHHHHQKSKHHSAPRIIKRAVPVAPAARQASSPALPAPVTPPADPPKLIGVGNAPGCMQGADPGATLQEDGANVLRVIISPNHGADGSAVSCLAAAVAEGARVELTLDWYGQWSPDEVLAYFRQTLPLYAPYVWALGIGNEQELRHDASDETPAQYAAVWQAVEPYAHALLPSAPLVAGAVSPWGLDWLQQAWRDGLPGATAVAGHPYVVANGFKPAAFVAWAQSVGAQAWFDEALAAPGSWGGDIGRDAMDGAELGAAWHN